RVEAVQSAGLVEDDDRAAKLNGIALDREAERLLPPSLAGLGVYGRGPVRRRAVGLRDQEQGAAVGGHLGGVERRAERHAAAPDGGELAALLAGQAEPPVPQHAVG